MKTAWIGDSIDHVAEAAVGNGTRLVPAETLLMVVRGMILAHTFPVALTTRSLAFNQDIKALRPAADLTPAFLLYWLQSTASEVLRRTDVANHGTRRVPTERLFALEVPVPPLAEQRRIAAILSSVDEVIEKTEAVIEQLRAISKSLRQELLTRGLPGRHTSFKQTRIGEVPTEWEVARIGTLFDIQLGKMLNKVAKKGREEYPYIANRNVQWGRLELHGLNTMSFSSREREKYELLPGDLLVCEGGEVGRTAIWRGELANCFFQKAIHRLRPRSDQVDPEFLLHFMRYAADMGLFVHLTGRSSIAHLTKEKLEIAEFPVPSVAEQREIAITLEVLDRAAAAEVKYLSSLRDSKSALMSVLLTGQLRSTSADSRT